MHSEVVSSKRTGKVGLAAFIVSLIGLMLAASANPAQAATITVTNNKDSGPGSLRSAIAKAAKSGDTIVFSKKVRGTIVLRGDYLYIDKSLTIRGPGANALTISGNNNERVFYVDEGLVRISGLTIARGYNYNGGGIYNDGNLTLTNCIVQNNAADYEGGGIYNDNVLNLTGTRVGNNSADGDGGGIYNDYGNLNVTRSRVSGNETGDDGGGIYDYSGSTVLSNSTVSENFASSSESIGGGLYNSGTLTVSQSTLSGNRAVYGAGVHTQTYSSEKATIANSTISGNSITSSTGGGGGIYNDGLTEIRNSTIAKNTAPGSNGGGIISEGYSSDKVVVSSSIVADNSGNGVQHYNSSNPYVSNGYNLIGFGNGAGAFNKTGDRTGAAAGLGTLANNGGSTLTHALPSGSPAVNRGSNANCPATDQRGVQRPRGGTCDIGAFEL